MTDTATVRLHASKIARQIQLASNATKGDEKAFREKVAPLFEQFADDTKIDLRQHDEYTLVTGRADTVYNRLVIEYEHPEFLRVSNEYANNKHAIQQVKDYIEGIQKHERQDVNRLVGAVLDGYFLIFVRHVGDSWRVDDPLRVDAVSVEYLLELLVKTSTGVALIPDNLIEDFGSKTLNAQRATRALYHALDGHRDDLVAKLFEQWQTFFGEVTGYEEGSARLRDKKELRAFAKGMGISPDVADPPRLFFAVHTYFAILIKLIAWLTLSRYNARLAPQFAELKDLESEELRARLERMERGALFREEFRIRNFLEGDFFGWYLKAWTPDIEKQIRSIVEKLSNYDPTTLEVSPEQTRDLLKKLYHYLMPRELRHDLGEYYTPDWLAERLLTQVDSSLFQPLTTDAARRQSLAYAQKNLLKLRFLDPACGSGTFIVLTIRRIRDLAQRLRMESSNEKKRWVLEAILNNVQGIDLNPLAVIAARTNYILALGDLMQILNRPEIDIPIYLADSILTPSLGEDIFTGGNYRIKTTVGEFLVPEAFNTKDRIDALAHALDEAVEAKPKVSADNFVARVNVAAGLSDKELEKAHRSLADLYKKLSELHSKGLNGVWARIIKNAFMPLFIGKFDYVVGNPPWVNWESLPGDYRQDTKPLWVYHGLFPHSGMDTILGKGKGDVHASSVGKFRRQLRRIVDTRQSGVFVRQLSRNTVDLASEIEKIKGGHTYVVDIAKLTDEEQTLVFGDILRKIYSLYAEAGEENQELPKKVIVFVDELNKYAPATGRGSSILTQVLDIAERGRSLGVILISAQQFLSAVHARVTGNSATQIIGRTGSSELSEANYRFLDPDVKMNLTRLTKGELVLSHAVYRQPVKIKFPKPAYKQQK